MPDLSNSLPKIYDNEIKKSDNLSLKQSKFKRKHPAISENPLSTELAKGIYDLVKTGKDVLDYTASLTDPNFTPSKAPFQNIFQNINEAEELVPEKYTPFTQMAQLGSQAPILEASGVLGLSNKLGSFVGKKFLSSLSKKAGETIGSTLADATVFTASSPEALTGSKDLNKNIIEDFNPASATNALLGNIVMIGGIKAGAKAGSLLLKSPSILNNMKQNETINNAINKVKSKYKADGAKKEARVYSDVLNDNAKPFNKTKDFSDINIIKPGKKPEIVKQLSEEGFVPLYFKGNVKNNFINTKIFKDGEEPRKNIILIHLTDKIDGMKNGIMTLTKNDSDVINIVKKYLQEDNGFSTEQANKFLKNNDIIIYHGDKINSKLVDNAVEHEIGHILNLDKQGIINTSLNNNFKNNNLVQKLYKKYNKNEVDYLLNQQEATQTIGSIVDMIKKTKNENELNSILLNKKIKKALDIYSDFTNEKIDTSNISKNYILKKLNNISDKVEDFHNSLKTENNKVGQEKTIPEPSNERKQNTVAEKANEINSQIDKISNSINGETVNKLLDLKNDIDFTKKTVEEHKQTLRQLRDEVNKAKEINNIQKVVELEKEKVHYVNKLYKDFGFENTNKINSIMNRLSKIEKQIEKRATANVKTDRFGKTIKNNGKLKIDKMSPVDASIVKNYQEAIKDLNTAIKEKYDVINSIFKNKKIFNELQQSRINEHIQKYNDLLIENANDINIPHNASTDELVSALKDYKQIEPLKLEEIEHTKQKNKKQNNIEKKVEPSTIESKSKNENKQNNNNKKNKINKENKKEKETNNKNNLNEQINNSSKVSFQYIKYHLKKVTLKLKMKTSKIKIKINIKEMIEKPKSNNITDGYFIDKKENDIFISSFQGDNHTLNFLNETRLIAHEITHLFINKTKNKDFLKKISIPERINNLYKDVNKIDKQEETVSIYSELRAMKDLLENSNVSSLVENKDTLINNINKEINNLFNKNDIQYLENFYKNNMQYNIFSNIKELYNNPIFNHKYFIEQADKQASKLINDFASKLYQKITKNNKIKNFMDYIANSDFIKNAIEDYKISHSNEELYAKIRNIISEKNRMMNTIKHLNNSFVKMISDDFKNINKETQKHIHNSDVINSFVGSGYKKLDEYVKTLLKNKDIYMKSFIEDNISKNKELFIEIIKQSSEPMNNNKLYFRNAEQIAMFLKKNMMLKTDIDKPLIQDINNLLTAEYLSRNKIDFNTISHINNKSLSVLSIAEIRKKAKQALRNDYIRGYRSFMPKKPLIAKLGLFDKEPTYSVNLSPGIDNNLLEFKQDSILGAEFRIKDFNPANIHKLRKIRAELDRRRIKYSIIYDKDMNEIGVKRYIEQYLDEKNMGSYFDIAENIASQHTSIMLNSVNYHIAEHIQKELKGVFLSENDIKNIKTSEGYVLLSKEERKIFKDLSIGNGDEIKYIKKEFKDLLDQQQEILFTTENHKIARAIEKSYKNIIKEFKKNVVVKNIKSQLNNAMIILTTTAQHNLSTGSVIKDIMRSPKEYKIFYNTIFGIRKEVLKGNTKKATIMYENLKRQNVYAQMYQNGLFQTMADNYLMKVSDKESISSYEINKFLSTIMNDDTVTALNKIKDFALLEPNTYLGSLFLKSMNFIDITGRATLYKNLLKKGNSIEEASRIANESFVDFRRTYPKIVNELDNYGLFFAGFMYKNTTNLLTFMKNRPVTTVAVILSYLAIKKLFDDASPVGIKTGSWVYQNSMITPSYIDMSLFGSLSEGKLPPQLVVPNTTLMAERFIKTGDIKKILPITIGNQYK